MHRSTREGILNYNTILMQLSTIKITFYIQCKYYMLVCEFAYVFACVRVRVCVRACVRARVCARVRVCMCVCTRVRVRGAGASTCASAYMRVYLIPRELCVRNISKWFFQSIII